MRLLVVITFLALVGFAVSVNITWGHVGPYDILLHHEIVKKSSSFLQVVTLDVTYPQKYERNNRTISGIRITDQIPKGKGGYAQLYAGGPGFNHTTIHFKSQRGNSFNFILEIFGARY
ncbi:hypothetical protein PVAND_013521 [Polypedilum vanderplanki]|uniref:Salivary secreted peptide n=1 Tax=Polypedilum vanderplanki TaxID=319348 RepID=A0A9J6CQK3_POLVA|nr:hypothetical protein PVAND_013521 [Polypedilum vanderplanki]